MPAMDVASLSDAKAVILSALNNAGISYSTDYATYNEDAEYIFIATGLEDRGFKKYIGFRFSGSSIELFACDDYTFYDVYDEETGEYLGRKSEIYGKYSIYSENYYSGTHYYNAATNKVMAVGCSNYNIYVIFCTDLLDNPVVLCGFDNIGFPLSEFGGGQFVKPYISADNYKCVYPLYFSRGGMTLVEIPEMLPSPLALGEVEDINGTYYVTLGGNVAVVGDGSEGSITQVEFREPYIADLDAGTAIEMQYMPIHVAELDITTAVEVISVMSIYVMPREEVDTRVSELIQQEPQSFPNVGQAVLERSKRVITRLEFG